MSEPVAESELHQMDDVVADLRDTLIKLRRQCGGVRLIVGIAERPGHAPQPRGMAIPKHPEGPLVSGCRPHEKLVVVHVLDLRHRTPLHTHYATSYTARHSSFLPPFL